MQRVYVDTNIWLDLVWNRDKRAKRFFRQALSCFYEIVVSDIIKRELEKYATSPQSLFEKLETMGKVDFVETSPSQVIRAKLVTGSHHNDNLHSILAQDNRCDILLTSNIRDFEECAIAKRYDDL